MPAVHSLWSGGEHALPDTDQERDRGESWHVVPFELSELLSGPALGLLLDRLDGRARERNQGESMTVSWVFSIVSSFFSVFNQASTTNLTAEILG